MTGSMVSDLQGLVAADPCGNDHLPGGEGCNVSGIAPPEILFLVGRTLRILTQILPLRTMIPYQRDIIDAGCSCAVRLQTGFLDTEEGFPIVQYPENRHLVRENAFTFVPVLELSANPFLGRPGFSTIERFDEGGPTVPRLRCRIRKIALQATVRQG